MTADKLHIFDKRFCAIQFLCAVTLGFLFTLAGAFQSFLIINVFVRFGFWSALMLPLWLLTALSSRMLITGFAPPRVLQLFIVVTAALLISLPGTAWVSWLLQGFYPIERQPNLDALFAVTLAVSLSISLIVWGLSVFGGAAADDARGVTAVESAPETHDGTQRFLQRLSPHKRGRLVSLAASDHYLEVTTETGTDVILMRLSDAERELGPALGMRIHRSHWAAFAAMREMRNRSGKWTLMLHDGSTRPVSRKHAAALKKFLRPHR